MAPASRIMAVVKATLRHGLVPVPGADAGRRLCRRASRRGLALREADWRTTSCCSRASLARSSSRPPPAALRPHGAQRRAARDARGTRGHRARLRVDQGDTGMNRLGSASSSSRTPIPAASRRERRRDPTIVTHLANAATWATRRPGSRCGLCSRDGGLPAHAASPTPPRSSPGPTPSEWVRPTRPVRRIAVPGRHGSGSLRPAMMLRSEVIP